MKKNIEPKTTSPIKPKAKRLAALENLREQLSLLVALQKNAVERIRHSDHDAILLIEKERLLIYDRFMRLLVCSFEDLQNELSKKQPGGAPRNPNRKLAMDILTSHYIETGKFLAAKVLSKRVIKKLTGEGSDDCVYFSNILSLRLARELIKDFKARLRPRKIDWN